jgi:hypothetical protein
MDSDLDIFRKRNEKKKKPESTEVIFLGQSENGESAVFSTDGETTKCLSTKTGRANKA